ncbi:hypothetical protein SISSUDRAFT_1034641 [Sistotremastrum suecicum HHB10207 ss-3]|uniref:Uncharacterized protein n=1 Tax=Sistotremastrum suecicum HHB10207 ss-3 TaxID=1314776 RepID=A0A166BU53_9AGAM|nr:hypothetical protein SISSUDRAFT_1034641 [Sistotremastrum suecicum HHB10207 ss-3]
MQLSFVFFSIAFALSALVASAPTRELDSARRNLMDHEKRRGGRIGGGFRKVPSGVLSLAGHDLANAVQSTDQPSFTSSSTAQPTPSATPIQELEEFQNSDRFSPLLDDILR